MLKIIVLSNGGRTMNTRIAFMLGVAFFVTGFQVSDAQALPALSQIENQFSADRGRLVTLFHRPSHTDCQKDNKGSHYHKGMKFKRVNCPGGKK
jgi:hypothetical protein